MAMTKFCKDCKYYSATRWSNYAVSRECLHPDAQRRNVVTAAPIILTPSEMRAEGEVCGPDAKLFAEKDPTLQVVSSHPRHWPRPWWERLFD